MTPEEKAVIQAAIDLRDRIPGQDIREKIALDEAVYRLTVSCPDCNRGGHRCPGDGNWIGHGETDCGEHSGDQEKEEERATGEDDRAEVWVLSEMRHARVGDLIRPAGTAAAGTLVVDRYLPPMKDASKTAGAAQPNAGHWHVVSGGPKHWDDRIVREGEVWLRLEGNAEPQNLDPTFAIEIKMSADLAELFSGNYTEFDWEDRMDAR